MLFMYFGILWGWCVFSSVVIVQAKKSFIIYLSIWSIIITIFSFLLKNYPLRNKTLPAHVYYLHPLHAKQDIAEVRVFADGASPRPSPYNVTSYITWLKLKQKNLSLCLSLELGRVTYLVSLFWETPFVKFLNVMFFVIPSLFTFLKHGHLKTKIQLVMIKAIEIVVWL